MKRAFKIENLDCASCGTKIEDAVNKIKGVNKASVNFLTQRFVLDATDEDFTSIVEQARLLCDRIEPGCTFS